MPLMELWIEPHTPINLREAMQANEISVGCVVVFRDRDGNEREMLIGDVNGELGLCGCCNVDVDVIRYREIYVRPKDAPPLNWGIFA